MRYLSFTRGGCVDFVTFRRAPKMTNCTFKVFSPRVGDPELPQKIFAAFVQSSNQSVLKLECLDDVYPCSDFFFSNFVLFIFLKDLFLSQKITSKRVRISFLAAQEILLIAAFVMRTSAGTVRRAPRVSWSHD